MDKRINFNEIIPKLVAEYYDRDVNQISLGTRLQDIVGLDVLNMVSFIVFVERRVGVRFALGDLERMATVRHIVEAAESKIKY